MFKKYIYREKFSFFLPLIFITSLYFLNSSARNTFLERQASFRSPESFRIILVFSMFLIFLLFISSLSTKIQNLRQDQLAWQIHLISYFIFILIPIFIDKYVGLNILESLSKIFRVSYINPIFADLNTILTGIGCLAVNEIGDKISCDLKNDVLWNYPKVLLHLRVFNIDSKITFALGYFIAIIFILMLALFRDLNKIQKIFLAFLVFSPPLLLVVNRGNFDLLILSCIAMAGYALNRNLKFCLELSYLLILFAASLKFYALFALPLLLFFNSSRRNYFYFVISSFGFLYFNFSDLRYLNQFIGRDMSGSFGLPVLISHLNGDTESNLNVFSFGSAIILILVSFYFNFFNKRFYKVKISNYNDHVFLLLSFSFAITWLLASNYYYRLVLLIFVIPFYFHKQSTSFENYVGLTSFISFYLSFRTFGFVMNILLIPMLTFNFLILYRILKRDFLNYVK
jgi:hypothetical protein